MSSHSKNAWLAFGLALTAAGTAYAAIPDANGVIHGCYNVLTGSARIVDGNSCGLLEKATTWQQTGPRGPAGTPGTQGPAGPQGPAGTSNITFGHAGFDVNNPLAPSQTTEVFADNVTITAPSHGYCALTISGTMLEATGSLKFRPETRRDDGLRNVYHSTAYMTEFDDNTGSGGFKQLEAAGTTMEIVELDAGHSYNFGVSLEAPFPITQVKPVTFALGWTCQYDG